MKNEEFDAHKWGKGDKVRVLYSRITMLKGKVVTVVSVNFDLRILKVSFRQNDMDTELKPINIELI